VLLPTVVDRDALARAAFASPEGGQRLNAIVASAIAGESAPISALRLLPTRRRRVIEVPLPCRGPVFAELADDVIASSPRMEVRGWYAAVGDRTASPTCAVAGGEATDAERSAACD